MYNRSIGQLIIDWSRIKNWFIYIGCAYLLRYGDVQLPLYPKLYALSFFFLCLISNGRILDSFFTDKHIRGLYLLPISMKYLYQDVVVALILDTIIGKFLPFVMLINFSGHITVLINFLLIGILAVLIGFLLVWKQKKAIVYLLVGIVGLVVNQSIFFILMIFGLEYLIWRCDEAILLTDKRSQRGGTANYFVESIFYSRYF